MQTKENLQFIVEDLFKQLHDDNVIYAEIRFAPLLHCEGDLNAKKVVDIMENACQLKVPSKVDAELGKNWGDSM